MIYVHIIDPAVPVYVNLSFYEDALDANSDSFRYDVVLGYTVYDP